MPFTVDQISRRRRALHSLVRSLGFTRNLVATDYRVVTPRIGEVQVDIAAFGRLPLDMSNAVLVGEVQRHAGSNRDHAVAAALALAAPVALVAGEDGFDVIDASNQKRIEHTTYSDRLSDRLIKELQPDRLLASKLRPRQLSLFPIDVKLLSNARRFARERLRDRVVDAKSEIRQLGPDLGIELTRGDVARILVDALTSLFVEDKFQINYESSEWWHEVSTRFRTLEADLRSFDRRFRSLYELARTSLRVGIDYRSLDSVVVSDLYEPRLVDPGDRDEFGVVYTPFELATRVLEHVPVELVAPEKRDVLDLACGSGTLLLSACDRLASAMPMYQPPGRLHNYLLRRIRGWDRDPFAVRLAHLSLTIHSHPLGNGWRIEQQDSLTTSSSPAVSIIIGNPPWLGRRSGRAGAVTRSRDDAVSPFILKALSLLPPAGLLGMLVPASWLTANHSAGPRQMLREQCEILEVWRLPQGTFPPADAKGAVIIARAKVPEEPRLSHYISRHIKSRKSLQAMYLSGSADRNILIPLDDGGDLGAVSAVTTWMEKAVGEPLTNAFQIRSGPTKGHAREAGEFYRWLADAKKMPHFREVKSIGVQMARYPGDFDPSASWSVDSNYRRQKLLISRVVRGNTPWKLKIGFAFEPIIPSNNQYALSVHPRWLHEHGAEEHTVLYALGAIMGSALVNAWIHDRVAAGNIPSALLAKLVLPPTWTSLAGDACVMSQMLSSDAPLEEVGEIARHIDRVVFDLYRVPTHVQQAAIDSVAGLPAREGVVRYQPPAQASTGSDDQVCRDGCVLGVDESSVTLWVDGITPDEGTSMPIPDRLPAAALLPSASFKVSCAPDNLLGGEFRLHRTAYLEDDGLTSALSL